MFDKIIDYIKNIKVGPISTAIGVLMFFIGGNAIIKSESNDWLALEVGLFLIGLIMLIKSDEWLKEMVQTKKYWILIPLIVCVISPSILFFKSKSQIDKTNLIIARNDSLSLVKDKVIDSLQNEIMIKKRSVDSLKRLEKSQRDSINTILINRFKERPNNQSKQWMINQALKNISE